MKIKKTFVEKTLRATVHVVAFRNVWKRKIFQTKTEAQNEFTPVHAPAVDRKYIHKISF